ncbi:hypothetical protein BGZ98_004333, partial [Dissophora globulifera]
MRVIFYREYKNETIIVGVDSGEVVSTSFCALDLKAGSGYQPHRQAVGAVLPALAYRTALERMKQRQVCLPSVPDLHVGAWCRGDDVETVDWQVELPSIVELGRSLPPHVFESIKKHETGLQDYHHVADVLNSFYGSRTLKKM